MQRRPQELQEETQGRAQRLGTGVGEADGGVLAAGGGGVAVLEGEGVEEEFELGVVGCG